MRKSVLLSATLAPWLLFTAAARQPPQDEVRDIKNGKLMRARRPSGEPAPAAPLYRPSKATLARASRPASAATPLDAELGLTVWTFRRSQTGDEVRPLVAVSRSDGSVATENWTPVRAGSSAPLKVGQFVRFTIEAPREGFVYVIARDRGPDGYLGDPMLVFPQRPGDDNAIRPGKPVSAPVWSDARQIYYTFFKYPEESTLDVVFLVTPAKLDGAAAAALGEPLKARSVALDMPAEHLRRLEALGVSAVTSAILLDNAQVDRLVDAWSAPSERLDRETTTVEEALTKRELAASVDRTAALTSADPGPQTLIRMAAKPADPWLAVLTLPIAD